MSHILLWLFANALPPCGPSTPLGDCRHDSESRTGIAVRIKGSPDERPWAGEWAVLTNVAPDRCLVALPTS